MCLLIFVFRVHFSLVTCCTYDNELDRIILGYCLAPRCAAASAILHTSLLILLWSRVNTIQPLASSNRRACLLISVIVGSEHCVAFRITVRASRDPVTSSTCWRSALEGIERRPWHSATICMHSSLLNEQSQLIIPRGNIIKSTPIDMAPGQGPMVIQRCFIAWHRRRRVFCGKT